MRIVRRALAVAIVPLAVVAGVAVAASVRSGTTGSVIHACYGNANGSMRFYDPAATSGPKGCKASETPLQWNVQGSGGSVVSAWDVQAAATLPVGGNTVDLGGSVSALAAGSYLLSGTATWPALDNERPTNVFCKLLATGTNVTGTTTGGYGAASYQSGATVTMMGSITVPTGSTADVQIQCVERPAALATVPVPIDGRIQVVHVDSLQ